jgi:hypothetical protein
MVAALRGCPQLRHSTTQDVLVYKRTLELSGSFSTTATTKRNVTLSVEEDESSVIDADNGWDDVDEELD